MYIYKDSLLAIPYCSLCTDKHTLEFIDLVVCSNACKQAKIHTGLELVVTLF